MWFIVAIVICVVIGYVAYNIIDMNIFAEKCEKERQEQEQKKMIFEERQNKRKAVYKAHLPNIYGRLTKQELEQAYSLLQIMCSNDYDFGDPNFSMETMHTYSVARDQLKELLNYPQWNVDNNLSESPLWCKLDLNYVYELLYR